MNSAGKHRVRRVWSNRVLLSVYLSLASSILLLLGMLGGEWSLISMISFLFAPWLGLLGLLSGIAALFSYSSRTGRNLLVLIPGLMLSGTIVFFSVFIVVSSGALGP